MGVLNGCHSMLPSHGRGAGGLPPKHTVVNGQLKLPVGGHENCPLVANKNCPVADTNLPMKGCPPPVGEAAVSSGV
jgi:hypothetical protein